MVQLELFTLLIGMQNGADALEDNLSVLMIKLNNSPPIYLPKRSQDIRTLKELQVHVPSSFIHNGQKLFTTQMSFNGWMDK